MLRSGRPRPCPPSSSSSSPSGGTYRHVGPDRSASADGGDDGHLAPLAQRGVSRGVLLVHRQHARLEHRLERRVLRDERGPQSVGVGGRPSNLERSSVMPPVASLARAKYST